MYIMSTHLAPAPTAAPPGMPAATRHDTPAIEHVNLRFSRSEKALVTTNVSLAVAVTGATVQRLSHG